MALALATGWAFSAVPSTANAATWNLPPDALKPLPTSRILLSPISDLPTASPPSPPLPSWKCQPRWLPSKPSDRCGAPHSLLLSDLRTPPASTLFCPTLKMSHAGSWRGACASTIRDRSRRWLWRLVGKYGPHQGRSCEVGRGFAETASCPLIPSLSAGWPATNQDQPPVVGRSAPLLRPTPNLNRQSFPTPWGSAPRGLSFFELPWT